MAFPWDFHPDLTRERLIELADLVAGARDAVVQRHDPSIGDDEWVLGCRAFQACCYAISTRALSGETGWLFITDSSRHFMFRVGQIPLRFYRGDPEDSTHRTKGQSFPELQQLSLVFPGKDMRALVCRLAVETDLEGRAAGIYCVGTRGEDVVFNWRIPFEKSGLAIAEIKPPVGGVDLAAPEVAELDEEVAENDNVGKKEGEEGAVG